MPKQLSPTDKRRKFRALMKRKRLTVMPGGFSPLYARLAQEAGHECFFMAGSQLSAFLYGVPDNGIISTVHAIRTVLGTLLNRLQPRNYEEYLQGPA